VYGCIVKKITMETPLNKTVLIVDDDSRNTFALSSYLETQDIKTVIAEDGEQAMSVLINGITPDIILLDIMMPEMDGYETLDVLRSHPSFKKIPVIAVTAKTMKGDMEKCIEAGAWDFISKPIDLNVLMNMINKWTTPNEF
jgi:CheY-like chemotaxis protein